MVDASGRGFRQEVTTSEKFLEVLRFPRD